MHELRRRFAIDGGDDDVTQVRVADGHIYVGLPWREGSLLGELLRGGEIGYELSLDPRTPVVIGVYPKPFLDRTATATAMVLERFVPPAAPVVLVRPAPATSGR